MARSELIYICLKRFRFIVKGSRGGSGPTPSSRCYNAATMQIQALMICVFFFTFPPREPIPGDDERKRLDNLEDLVEGLGDGVLERGAVGLEEEVLVNVETGEADADELEEVGHCDDQNR